MDPAPAAPRPGWPRRLLRGLGTLVAALWVVLEEWIWDNLTAAMAWLGRLPIVRGVEARIARLPAYWAMAIFLVPMAGLMPAKIFGLWLIGTGHIKAGATVFVAAKILGTAVAARLFTLTRPALLSIGWFARVYAWFCGWRDRMHAYLRSLRIWQAAKAWAAKVRATLRAWVRSVFAR